MTPMMVQCSSCLTEFELDPRKVPADGVRARCSVCASVIVVPAPPTVQEPQQEPQQEPHEQQHEQPRNEQREQEQPEQNEHAEPPEAASVQAAPAHAEEQAGSEAPQAPAVEPPPVAPEEPAQQPQAAQEQPEPRQPEPQQPEPQQPTAETATASDSQTATAAPSQPSPGAQRRPINPFLARDPALRAKRLARALVSDIVAYHPARHAEGLRDGTLKTLFRDEIKKSYEEYVDQVGREFAGSTTHFQDALNDVLASGKKLF